MAQGRSTTIISMIQWTRTSRLSTKISRSLSQAQGKGGAASVQGSSSSAGSPSLGGSFVECVFERNNASGLGGGAIHVKGRATRLRSLSTAGNAAPYGGGGVLLWEGGIPPEELGGSGIRRESDSSNRAAYGPLRATLYVSLAVLPSEPLAWPGVELEVIVEKRDYYGQRIVNDDISFLKLSAVPALPTDARS